jgi:integrase
VFGSLGCNQWAAAEKEVVRLYERGCFPKIEVPAQPDAGAITVRYAGERYLKSRKDGSLDPIEKDTYDHYAVHIQHRLYPFCEAKGIVYIRDFENPDLCRQYTESWRQLWRNVGELLGMKTRKVELQRFRTFLNFCVDNGWMTKNGATKVKTKNKKTAEEEERFGLELLEYQQMLDAPDSADLTLQENQETRAAAEVMRWSGPRISDAHKLNDSEIVRNESGDGWNLDFVQKKTKRRCITPLPAHVKSQLDALPGRQQNGKKFFLTCTYTALRERVCALAKRAQKEKPFTHPFSPHCLRQNAESRKMPSRALTIYRKPLEYRSRAIS